MPLCRGVGRPRTCAQSWILGSVCPDKAWRFSRFGLAGADRPRAAHRARLAHADIHQLATSMQRHSEIPVTFDWQAPELAFSNLTPRLIVGERYVVPDGQGKEQHGTLMQAVVVGSNAMGIYTLDNGQSAVNERSRPRMDVECRELLRISAIEWKLVEVPGSGGWRRLRDCSRLRRSSLAPLGTAVA